MKCAVSVITPAYNAAPFIAETIASVRAQTFADWEMIIADDGSTDDTVEVARRAAAGDDRIRVLVAEKNSGLPAVARNRALAESTAPVIAFLDADDIWMPEKLERQLRLLEETKAGWCFSNSLFFGEGEANAEGPKYPGDWAPPRPFFPALLAGEGVPCLTIMMRRELLESVCPGNNLGRAFDKTFVVGEDWELTLRLALVCEPAYVPEVLAHYRAHQSGISKRGEVNFDSYISVIEKHSDSGVGENVLRRARRLQWSKRAVDRLFAGGGSWRGMLLGACLQLPLSARDLYLAQLALWPASLAKRLYRFGLARMRSR